MIELKDSIVKLYFGLIIFDGFIEFFLRYELWIKLFKIRLIIREMSGEENWSRDKSINQIKLGARGRFLFGDLQGNKPTLYL